jgi:hypothetical protein
MKKKARTTQSVLPLVDDTVQLLYDELKVQRNAFSRRRARCRNGSNQAPGFRHRKDIVLQ